MVKKLKSKRGFTLAEMLIVVALIGILSTIAFVFVNPKDISYVELNRGAEAIAAAAQNRLTEIRNSGDMETLRSLGEQAAQPGKGTTGEVDPKAAGGYRYIFNYTDDKGTITKNGTGINYILPFGAIDSELSKNYYAIGFQSDTGIVYEVFYSDAPFGTTVTELQTLSGDSADKAATRKAKNVGYYVGTGDIEDKEMAFANLPTPQLTITNYEELTLSIYLPEVKQLEKLSKEIGIIVSLSDEDGKAYSEQKLSYKDTAIYSTFSLGESEQSNADNMPVVKEQKIASGATYTMILDTVKYCNPSDMSNALSLDGNPKQANSNPPKGKFEDWAKRSKACSMNNDQGPFVLGDNSVITVTVYCLFNSEGTNNKVDPVDPTYMPRSASVTFNGWFDHYAEVSNTDSEGKVTITDTVDIACGRHLQNLNNLSELNKKLAKYMPTVSKDKNGNYTYSDYNYGKANTYTDGSSSIDKELADEKNEGHKSENDPNVYSEDISNKYNYRKNVKQITVANQVNAIDFDNEDWKNGEKQIPFTPICLPQNFHYYGNYLTITHLYVNAPFYAGLFGYVYHQRMYDILLVNPSVTSQAPAHLAEIYEMGVGALIGTSRDSSHINNCQVYMTPEGGSYHPEKYRVQGECYVGGLIGFCEDEQFANCSASVYTGYAKGATKAVTEVVNGVETTKQEPISSRYVGGLIGCITGDSSLDDCYAAGNLTGEYVGGLLGYVVEDSDPSGDEYRIETCYTAGHIEYATQEAAGILGRISELAGTVKSAVSVYGNYCAVIYGESANGTYTWENESVPIYGTFKGDGFEWSRITHGSTLLKGKYANDTFFAGAQFELDNRNYYIAQEGITYSNSPYYTSMYSEINKIINSIEGKANSAIATVANNNLLSEVKTAQEKIGWLKKLQALEDLKAIMDKIIYEMDNETGKDITGKAYNLGGYSSHGTEFWLDKDNAEVFSKDDKEKSQNSVKLTAVQAIHAMYDGKYTDDDNQTHTITITDKHHNKTDAKEEGAFDDFTFIGFYNALQDAYKHLLDDDTSNDSAAQATIKFIFGDNTRETYTVKDDKGKDVVCNFYQDGRFYKSFYDHMLRRVVDKSKDYYEYYIEATINGNKVKGDKNGELFYRHLRSDYVEERFLELICDLGMSDNARDDMLKNAKIKELTSSVELDKLQKAIDFLNNYKNIINLWNNGMYSYKGDAEGFVEAAVNALTNLKKTLANDAVGKTADFYKYTEDSDEALHNLYDFFNKYKDTSDVISTDKDSKTNDCKQGNMRNLRNPIKDYYGVVNISSALKYSGVERILDEYAAKCAENRADENALKTQLVEELKENISTDWGDSGHKFYDSEEIRNAARGFVDGIDTKEEDREDRLGFMYDYGNKNDDFDNPYYKKLQNDSYVNNTDNKVLNNVFPYIENENTHYYPFPFVYGCKTRGSENDKETKYQATYVLFHYGDWLTDDLWAEPDDPATAALNTVNSSLKRLEQGLRASILEAPNSDTTGNAEKYVEKTFIPAVQACIGNVKTALESSDASAKKTNLKSIKTTIEGWLEVKEDKNKNSKDGAFAQLEAKIKNKPGSAAIIADLNTLKTELQFLITKIDEALDTEEVAA